MEVFEGRDRKEGAVSELRYGDGVDEVNLGGSGNGKGPDVVDG